MKTKFLLSVIFLLMLAGTIFSQTDLKSVSKTNYERPNTISGLNPGEYIISGNTPPYDPDWTGSDILVYSGNTTQELGQYCRILDMKRSKDGNLHLATCYNYNNANGIRYYRSTNSGLTWTLVKHLMGPGYYSGLSMLVERNHPSNNDSTRVLIFYTYAVTNTNDDATLRLWTFLSNGSGSSISMQIDAPSSGREYNFPTAVSNGATQSMLMNVGVVCTESANDGTAYQLKYFWSNVGTYIWGEQSYYLVNFKDYWPSAANKNVLGSDSVVVVTECREILTDHRQLNTYTFSLINPGNWRGYYITNNINYFYRHPCITIPQRRLLSDQIFVTYIRASTSGSTRGLGRYAYSNNYGITYSVDNSLSSSYSTDFTWCCSDTNRTGNNYIMAIYGDYDSLNVKRGYPSNMGSASFDMTNNYIDYYLSPVCAIYNNAGTSFKRSAFAYWSGVPAGTGTNVYFDSENLPTGIKNIAGEVYSYSLSQNFPNPFNPATYINYSIPENEFVKIVVCDILGREVSTLVNCEKQAGTHQVVFDASELNSGVYFYKIKAGNFTDVKKMLVVK